MRNAYDDMIYGINMLVTYENHYQKLVTHKKNKMLNQFPKKPIISKVIYIPYWKNYNDQSYSCLREDS